MYSLSRVSIVALIAASFFLYPNRSEAQQPEVVSDPNRANFITEDIDLFWRAIDAATPETLAEKMKDDYFGKSSGAVRDFVPNRIVSEHELAKTIVQRPERYSAEVRERMGRIDSFQSKIRASYYALKYLYPPAVFPNTYFVVGRLNSGGTTSPRGLLIGAEMYAHSDEALLDIPTIVAHEWAHFNQQFSSTRTLLEHSLYEGGADFIAELATGKHINQAGHSFGDKHSAQLWKIFSAEADEPYEQTAGWLYGGSPIDGGPNDLGYYIGYKICESYYARADNKQTAVYDILNVKDARQFLQSSRFEERFLSPSELAPPKIVSSSPADGDQGVDPETQQIKIEFSLPMDGRYSINPVDAAFPQVTGLKWNDQRTQLTLSVELESMTRYQLTFNSHQHKGFASQRGKVLAPHVIEFTTK